MSSLVHPSPDRRRSVVRPLAVVGLITLAACGTSNDGNGKATGYAAQLNTICSALDKALSVLPPTPAKASATAASAAIATAGQAAAKLSAPANRSTEASTFAANLQQAAKLLTELAAGNPSPASPQVATVNGLLAANTKLGDQLGATRCALDPLFAPAVTAPSVTPATVTLPTVPDVTTPVTTPPVGTVSTPTLPVVTTPPVTAPVVTIPNITIPNITIPNITIPNITIPNITIPNVTIPQLTIPGGQQTPGVAGQKRFEDLSKEITPKGNYAFNVVDQSALDTFLAALSATPAFAASSGVYGGIDIVDTTTNIKVGRVLAYVYDTPLAPGSLKDWIAKVAPNPPHESTVAGIPGQQYRDASNFEEFVTGTDDKSFILAIGTNGLTLGAAVAAFFESITPART